MVEEMFVYVARFKPLELCLCMKMAFPWVSLQRLIIVQIPILNLLKLLD